MSFETPLTIPGTLAYHVVGDTSVELADGDLTVVVPPPASPIAPTKAPVLMLTVGQAAFKLYRSTLFGTVAGDERVYLFQPELGEGLSGYVKLVLPEGVKEQGTEFSALQERFEKLLISRGLLKEGDGPNERSATIPSVIAAHVLGETVVELAKGTLTLSTVTPSLTAQGSDPKPILILSVGSAAFTLHPTTVFGTVANDEHVYVFKPEIQDASLPVGGYVKLTLPEKSKREIEVAQEQFEQILIDYGLLKTGVEAAADEVGKSVGEEATSAAQTIRQDTAEYLKDKPPTDKPLTFSDTTHSVAAKGSSATTTLYTAAQSVSSAVSSAASSAGAYLSSKIGGGPPSPSTTATASSVGDAYTSVARGTAEVKDAAADSFGDVVQNRLGAEARELGQKVAGGMGNVGGAVGQVTEVGTGAVLLSGGVKGAVGLAGNPEDVESGSGFVNGGAGGNERPAQEMATFTIEEKEDGEDFGDMSI